MILSEIILFEMARVLDSNETGIGNGICIKLEPVGGRHGPRIKVSNVRNSFRRSDCFVVTVDRENPAIFGSSKLTIQEMSKIKYWVVLNHDILHYIWRFLETNKPQQITLHGKQVMVNFEQLISLLTKLEN